ncbi:hypothetical protein PQG02_33220 (plasmid) [Nostoc sp. UHCC 0926]|nr:hypothetical protein PQG02_33220 [Nostoc sp. UHCC 0926]
MLQQWFSGGQILSQKGKYAVNLGQGHEIYIGIASTKSPSQKASRKFC